MTPPPETVPPELSENLIFAYSAYRKLSSDRDSMGSMRIRYSAIDAYATRYGITSIDEFERFLGLIEILDNKYLEINAEMEKANANRRTNQNADG